MNTTTLLLPAYSQVRCDDIAQTFSDVYKSDNGFRPRLGDWSRAQMEAWLDSRVVSQRDDAEYIDSIAEQYYLDLEMGLYDDEADEDEDYTGLASEYQEGWA